MSLAPRNERRIPAPVAPALPDGIQSLLDAVEDPVSVATAIRDREGRILDFRVDFVNAAACAWAGLARKAIVGRLVGELLPNLRPSGLFEALVSVVESGQPVERTALRYDVAVPGGRAIAASHDVNVTRLGDGYLSAWREVGAEPSARDAASTERLRAALDAALGVLRRA